MNILQIKKSKNIVYLWYTILFFVMIGVIGSVFILNEKTFLMKTDPFAQDFPVFVYLGHQLQAFMKTGTLQLFDFSIGLGEDIIGALAYYGIGDPLNLLSVFITEGNVAFLYAAVLFIRIYLAGIGMICYCRYHEKSSLLSLGGGYSVRFFSVYVRKGFANVSAP